MDAQKYTCPSAETIYLGQYPTKELSQTVTHTITIAEYQENIDPVDILFGSWIKCAQLMPGGKNGSWSGCAWAALDVTSLFAGKILRPIADAVRAVDAAARTGIGFADAYNALRTLGLPEDVVARIGFKGLDELVDFCIRNRVRAPLVSRASVAGEGCPTGLIGYNSDELGHMAYKFRMESGYYGASHNVAVAKVPGWNDPKTGDLVVASSGFSGHSETALLDKLAAKGVDPHQITALYTERQPCGACASELAAALKVGTPVTWSVPYPPGMEGGAKELLAFYIKEAGGGRLARSLSDHQWEEK
ncbi:nucleic acid/nucleotide deaminase domain-containing protein [Streptomyces sp. SID10853]|uniref:nucleic acid/nucleotide deaminase domain-containing protein n=1 Tax=Streptomyces sp. SID10853 TaxID=2706028 RepID=UPI0031BA9602